MVDLLRPIIRAYRVRDGSVQGISSRYWTDLADLLIEQKEYEEASGLYEEYIELMEESGTRSKHQAYPRYRYAFTLRGKGEFAEAARTIEEAIKSFNPDEDIHESITTYMLEDLALTYLKMGDLDKATGTIDRLKPFIGMQIPMMSSHIGRYLGIKALLSKERNDPEKAEDLARRGVNVQWSNKLVEVEDMAFNLGILADVLEWKQDHAGTKEARQEAKDLLRAGTKAEYCIERGIPSFEE
jgi:tetratricopeptide (TPR) repeat protein